MKGPTTSHRLTCSITRPKLRRVLCLSVAALGRENLASMSEHSILALGQSPEQVKPLRTSFDDAFDDGPCEWEELNCQEPPTEEEVRAAFAPRSPAPTELDSSASESPARTGGAPSTPATVELPLRSPSSDQSSTLSPPPQPPAVINPVASPASHQSRKRYRSQWPLVGYYEALAKRRVKRGPSQGVFRIWTRWR